jgi:hypothetical protein
MPQIWQRLPLSSQERAIPPLLFKYCSTPKGYDIFLTDLIHIWSEQLGHKGILKRAYDNETSIDPGEDAEQFDVLLQKIEEALRGSEASSITIRSGLIADTLELTIITKLPAPLQPLQWTVCLSKSPQAELTRHLILPLLKSVAEGERREKSLLDSLRGKDWVLGKLLDKIESSALDLSTAFPGTAGLRSAKKGTIMSQAAKHIKGIAPFDEEAWRRSIKGETTKSSVINVMDDLLAAAISPGLYGSGVTSGCWWKGLHEAPISKLLKEREIMAGTLESSHTPASGDKHLGNGDSDGGEFQVRSTTVLDISFQNNLLLAPGETEERKTPEGGSFPTK